MKKAATLSAVSVLLIAVCIACLFWAGVLPLRTEEAEDNSYFEVHFIDVGQADAALVLCDGKSMLVDGGNCADSSLIYTYLKKQNVTHLDHVVASHPHEDHAGGLAGALSYATVGRILSPVTSFDGEAFDNLLKWAERREAPVVVPTVGEQFELGIATVRILGLNAAEDLYEDTNNTSIILRVDYGDTSFLFTGDAEYEAETEVLNSGLELRATVLKVGHHGSYTSTSYRFLREVDPDYAVISVGADNEYGHPHDEPLSRLRDAEVEIYRTDLMGDIICKSDGRRVVFETVKNKEETTDGAYMLNTYRMKYHSVGCSNAYKINKENSELYHGTTDRLTSMGYVAASCCD